MMRVLPVDPDWDELFFMAHEILGLSMDEFLYEYNLELLTYMLNRKIELRTGANTSEEQEQIEQDTEARSFFHNLGF